MEIISKEEAKKRYLKYWFSGLPCPQGHIAERYVSGNACCVICARLRVSMNAQKAKEDRGVKARHRGSIKNHVPTIEGARLIQGKCQSASED